MNYTAKLSAKRVSRSAWGNFLVAVFLLLLGAFTILPIYYSIVSSLKPLNELFLYPPRVFVAAISTAGYVLVASMAAYPLAKHRFPMKKVIVQLVVFAILFRPEVTSIPQYIIMAKLQVIDTYWALILPAMGTSFGVFLLMQFMEAIPNEIIESCRIDGAKEVTLFFRLILPMVKPAWLTVVIFTFTSVWNTNGVQFIYSESRKMLPAMLSQLSGAGVARAGVASAVAVLLLIPPVVIFLFSQKSVVETMAHSGLKG